MHKLYTQQSGAEWGGRRESRTPRDTTESSGVKADAESRAESRRTPRAVVRAVTVVLAVELLLLLLLPPPPPPLLLLWLRLVVFETCQGGGIGW